MSLSTITPAEAKRLIAQGATLIDIRDKDEHAREHIAVARNRRLGTLTDLGGVKGPDHLSLPRRATHRGQCGSLAAGGGLRGLYPRRRHRRLEAGRAACRGRQEPADRDQPAGDDRRRQPRR